MSTPVAAEAGAAEPACRERAPAKLNLDLLVTGRRADGYHLLDSLIVFLDLADELAFAPAPALRLASDGPLAAELPADEANIVLRAAKALAAWGQVDAGAAITLVKRLPVAAGIGGGSADAAATLRGLSRLWGLAADPAKLMSLALTLGADVPACLVGRPARMRGVGEELEPMAGLPPLDLVLVNPRRQLATAAVFAARSQDTGTPRETAHPTAAGLLAALARSRNDLEAPAMRLLPEIGAVLAALRALPACRLARMSGSGPTCFGLFDDAATATAAAAALARAHPGWWVRACRSEGSA